MSVPSVAQFSHRLVGDEYRVKKLREPEATRYETRNEEKRRLKAEASALKDQKTLGEEP